ncbi:glycoprotein 3-alpha-L-fucosyltransferase A-like [Ornithodoros turicata]|uniref:glycoprotein 3-alpha-L-fucosyltransferase A-like n=1 Tax=Ornithodoros turicata TaxID=34597 RepID=UPI00313A3F9A
MLPTKKFRLRRLLITAIGLSCGTLLFIGLRDPSSPYTAPGGREDNVLEPKDVPESHEPQALPRFEAVTAAPSPADEIVQPGNGKPWFMKQGTLRPSPGHAQRLWPHQVPSGDRIVDQLMYMPQGYARNATKLKKIVLMYGLSGWGDLPKGRSIFLRDKCPVDTCEILTSQDESPDADAILFKDRFTPPKHRRNPNQVWMLYLLECPYHTQGFKGLKNIFNWTATYRHDSDIVAPYEKFVSFEPWLGRDDRPPVPVSSRNKTKKVAWFVSNCAARNQRLQYARELSAYIDVHIYGQCGPFKCPRSRAGRCFDLLDRDYKFYLAFENSNCKDYITEKFFVNGLGHDVLPIAMGAQIDDYRRSSPNRSFIHVETFPSPRELADFLHLLDRNDTLYNEYFRWKGTGEFVNTYFWCRVCAMLHAPPVHKVYPDIHAWWSGPGTCNTRTWKAIKRKHQASIGYVFT